MIGRGKLFFYMNQYVYVHDSVLAGDCATGVYFPSRTTRSLSSSSSAARKYLVVSTPCCDC